MYHSIKDINFKNNKKVSIFAVKIKKCAQDIMITIALLLILNFWF